MLNFLLNRGGAGVSLSRQETVERLNPLIRRHYALNHAYNYVIENTPGPEVAARLEAYQKIARADIGKMAETVFSSGGVAYNGIDLESSDVNLGTDPAAMLDQLLDQERDFQQAVAAEFDVDHHIRTQAILSNVRTNSQSRLNYLQDLTRSRRPESARR